MIRTHLPLFFTLFASSTAIARDFDIELNYRYHAMSVPNAILDNWFFDSDAEGWLDVDGRPKIGGNAHGIELVTKKKGGGANGVFYFDYLISTMKAGNWDDIEQPHNPFDGTFNVPSPNLGMWMLGADYLHEIPIVKPANTQQRFGLSFLAGMGLGIGGVVGEVYQWGPDQNTGLPGFTRARLDNLNTDLADGTQKLPSIIPILDVTAGLRATFGQRVVLRLDGGFRDMLYAGGSLGILF